MSQHNSALTFGIAILMISSLAWSQPDDHLKCYSIKDSQAKRTYTADLTGLSLEPGCTVQVPAKQLCVPTAKTNITPAPPGGGPTGTPNAFACYKVKCPKTVLPVVTIRDQFGNRTVTPKKARLLCAPSLRPTSEAPCGDVAGPMCDGLCPIDQSCLGGSFGQCHCSCVNDSDCNDSICSGGGVPAKCTNGQCACQISTAGSGCDSDAICNSNCASSGAAGGSCVPPGNSCVCIPNSTPGIEPCGTGSFGSPPQCWGECPSPDQVCVDAGGTCQCSP